MHMMRLSCLTLSFQNQFRQGKMDIFKFIQQCRALNFDGIDPHMNNLGGTGKDHLKKVRRLALDSGLSIASMCVSTEFGRDAAAVPAQIEKAREAMEVGMMLGAPVLRVFVGSAPSPDKAEEAFQRGADALRKCAEIGAEMGMPVALQNHSGLTSTGDDMLKFYDGKIAKWWRPDDVVFVDELPHTATGKLSKKALREKYRDYRLPTV